MQLHDLGRQSLADAFDGIDFALGNELLEFVALEGLDCPRPARIRTDLERILALELHKGPNLGEYLRDLVLGHRGISDGPAGEFNAGRRLIASSFAILRNTPFDRSIPS